MMTTDGALSPLLSRLLISFMLESDNEFEHHMPHKTALFGEAGPAPRVSSTGRPMRRPWLVSLAMWSNGMRFVPPDGVPLASLAGLGANLPGLQRWGYVRQDPSLQPDQLLRPTRAGRYAQAIWERLEDAIERRWEQRFGLELVAELKTALACAGLRSASGRPARNLPLYLPMVGYANGMRTSFVSPADEQLAAAGDSAALGLPALLSRALILVTLDYEGDSPLSLPISVDILPAIGTDSVRLRDVPLRAAVSKEAVSAATGFLERRGFATTGPGPVVTLTDRGLAALDAHHELLRAAERRWAERCGAAQIERLRGCVLRFADGPGLELGLRPYPEGWRARTRYKAQTEAVLADPWTALPAHPMALHRGGYPDGS
jgi:hypothetical protein